MTTVHDVQVQAAGMQFATSGYVVQGQPIELIGPQATIRVGDGTLSGCVAWPAEYDA